MSGSSRAKAVTAAAKEPMTTGPLPARQTVTADTVPAEGTVAPGR